MVHKHWVKWENKLIDSALLKESEKQFFLKTNYKLKDAYQTSHASSKQKMKWIKNKGINNTASSRFLILKH